MKSNSDFFERVWLVVREVPRGRVTSYGAIARYLGAAKSSRTVGYAMNASHSSDLDVPAHRVVNRNGVLTGKNHFSNLLEMEHKLKAEGVAVEDDQVVEFKKLFWDPTDELQPD